MSMDLDDLWLRDGDERFARFLRRLGFDHDEAADLAERTRPPWRGWDWMVPRPLLPKDDIHRQLVPMQDGSGWVEPPPPIPVAGHLRETAELLARPTGIPEAVERYRRNTTPGNFMPGPEYEGEPIIVTEERDMTEQIARGETGYRDR